MNETIFTSAPYTLENLRSLISADMQRVDRVITDNLASDIGLINQLGQHIIQSGGKRLRPMLVLLAAKNFGYEGDDDARLAAVVEFIHTATLLHDDVVDDSQMRRGQKTASYLWGNKAAVLVGDYLYSRAFQMMVQAQSMAIMNLLSNTTNTIAQGEVLQLLNVNDPDTSEEKYHQVIYAKTACLFEAATHIGAMLGKCDSKTEAAMATYGKHLGTAFQLTDDMLDYNANGATLGKNVGDDLAEGKPTLPLIYAMQHGNSEQVDLIRQAIKQGGLQHFDAINAIIQATGALDYTFEQAQNEVENARLAISTLPAGEYKQALMFLAEYAVKRYY